MIETTGTKDKTYDLISCCYHALQAAEICLRYRGDAEDEGDDDAVEFFDRVIAANRDLADEAKRLIAERLSRADEKSANQVVTEQSEQSFPASDAPAH